MPGVSILDVVRFRTEPQSSFGQEVVALRSFVTHLEFPELGPELEFANMRDEDIQEHTYFGKYVHREEKE